MNNLKYFLPFLANIFQERSSRTGTDDIRKEVVSISLRVIFAMVASFVIAFSIVTLAWQTAVAFSTFENGVMLVLSIFGALILLSVLVLYLIFKPKRQVPPPPDLHFSALISTFAGGFAQGLGETLTGRDKHSSHGMKVIAHHSNQETA